MYENVVENYGEFEILCKYTVSMKLMAKLIDFMCYCYMLLRVI